MNTAVFGPLAAFMSSVTWAIGSAAYGKLARVYSAPTVNFTRALVALPLFVLAAFLVAGGWSEGCSSFALLQSSHLGWMALSMTCSYAFGDTMFMWSMRSLGVPGALAISSAYPVWTLCFSRFVLGQSVTGLQALGVLVTVCGVVAVILNAPRMRELGENGQGTERFGGKMAGVTLAIGASICWGLNSYAVGKGAVGISPLVGNSLRMCLALLFTGLLRFLIARKSPWVVSAQDVKAIWWIFVMETFGGSLFFMWGLANSPLVLGSTLTALSPVVAVPIALVLRVERFSLPRTIGVVSVVAGIWMMVS